MNGYPSNAQFSLNCPPQKCPVGTTGVGNSDFPKKIGLKNSSRIYFSSQPSSEKLITKKDSKTGRLCPGQHNF